MNSWVRKTHWRRDRLPTPVFLGFTSGSAGKESTCNVEDLGLIPVLGRFPGKGKGYPLLYSGLENSIDSIVNGATKNWTRLSDFHFHFSKIALAIWGLLCFHTNCEISGSSSLKNTSGDLLGIALYLRFLWVE